MKLKILKLRKNNFIMKEVMDFERSFLMDKLQRREYEQREKALRDYYSYIGESYEEGIQQREQNKSKEIALRMLKRGKDINEIAEDTGLSIEEIQKLKA